MARYLDPKNDLVFKKVFDKHPALLKSFLNAVMPLPTKALIDRLEYLSPENVPDIPNLEAYSRNWDAIKTERMLMNDKLAEGFEKGLEKGLEKVEEEKYKIARNLLAKGLDVNLVSESTGLPVTEVEKIKATIQ